MPESILKKCLDSLISQTLKEIEIILVLDIPTDGSDKVAEAYAKCDGRIKLIRNKENLHTGLSRNIGIESATGEYIGFADHDDYCDKEMFEQLYRKATESDADVVISNFWDEGPEGCFEFTFPDSFSDSDFQKKAFGALIRAERSKRNSKSFGNMNNIWNQIYRRSFIYENDIRFLDNRALTMEDVFFSIMVYHFAQKTVYLPRTYYHHVTTGTNNYRNYDYESIPKVLLVLNSIYEFLEQYRILKEYKNDFAIQTLRRLYSSMRNEVKFKGFASLPRFVRQVKKDNRCQEMLTVFSENRMLFSSLPITKRVFARLVTR